MKILHTAHQNELDCKDKKHHSNIRRLVVIAQHSVPRIGSFCAYKMLLHPKSLYIIFNELNRSHSVSTDYLLLKVTGLFMSVKAHAG